MDSPCTKICRLEGEYCLGCGRTLEEIRNWGKYSVSERMNIIKQLTPERCPGCGVPNRCAVSQGKSLEACWCFGKVPPKSVTEQLVDDPVSCLCSSCLLEEKN